MHKAGILFEFRLEHFIQICSSFFKNRCLVIRYDSHSDSSVHAALFALFYNSMPEFDKSIRQALLKS
ncbi:hypothetical protein JCM21738_5197 [Mesobacillus boroniphilus JCM 21738]|uniref:Uncharacterized protein n=1 Tax=Mesobacillus boroniphilus JCM 21738 TaxID=1294265 RepID=W4RW77_9BACI|nr:hypothetical protein JCM21738_5197 [Mesobacillus boroniphilus JCM 21738]